MRGWDLSGAGRRMRGFRRSVINVLGYAVELACCSICLMGCSPTLSSPEQIREFNMAGPTLSNEAVNSTDGGAAHAGPYIVIPGDLLELQIPAIVRNVSYDVSSLARSDLEEGTKPYSARVNDAGDITLPIVGDMHVAGKTVAEIEALIVNAYYPTYVVSLPMVVCQVAEYQNENERVFTVIGLVNRPNTFPYLPDVRYNLTEALAFAGGINMVADPRYVKVYRQKSSGEIMHIVVGIDDKSLSDACNVAIKPGDVVSVDNTFRTRTNQFLAGLFHVGVGADFRRYD